ncbi:hypothetical protein BRARA_E00155 [Brassica rapa]|uniref:Uncharacterized protein n=1 Tax=Brassica campestris TaxID=3711 RepID=A0A397Z632_BRACM|nr:hypothetical protein BRARA_E00155 [Brassica rapa]
MAVDDDSNNSNTVKCICSDKKAVEVDRKTWELFNKMVPMEGFHRIPEPVEMYFVRSTAFKKILTYCVRISDGTCSERWMYDELLHGESLIGLFHLVGTADFLNFESLDAFILHYVEDKSEEEISCMVRNEELKRFDLLNESEYLRRGTIGSEELFRAIYTFIPDKEANEGEEADEEEEEEDEEEEEEDEEDDDDTLMNQIPIDEEGRMQNQD